MWSLCGTRCDRKRDVLGSRRVAFRRSVAEVRGHVVGGVNFGWERAGGGLGVDGVEEDQGCAAAIHVVVGAHGQRAHRAGQIDVTHHGAVASVDRSARSQSLCRLGRPMSSRAVCGAPAPITQWPVRSASVKTLSRSGPGPACCEAAPSIRTPCAVPDRLCRSDFRRTAEAPPARRCARSVSANALLAGGGAGREQDASGSGSGCSMIPCSVSPARQAVGSRPVSSADSARSQSAGGCRFGRPGSRNRRVSDRRGRDPADRVWAPASGREHPTPVSWDPFGRSV